MNKLYQDIRYALRQLRLAPAFTATAILTLALGIGANTAVFTLIHEVILKSLPVADPGGLTLVGDRVECCVESGFQEDWVLFSYPLYQYFQEHTPEFAQLAAAQTNRPGLAVRTEGATAAENLAGELVSGNYFSTLGVGAAAGRLHVAGDPTSYHQAIRRTLTQVDPNLIAKDMTTFDEQIAERTTDKTMMSRLTGLFGLVALLLASIGLYGLTAYQVARRPSEIGIRMALGANRLSILRLVLNGAFLQVAVGLALGIPLVYVAGRLIASQLFGVRSFEPLTLTVAIFVLALCAFLASILPARRAASIDPMRALRTE